MSNFIKVAYGVVNGAGVDTSDMTTEEVVKKFKELSGGKDGWAEKAFGEEASKKTENKSIEGKKEQVLNAGLEAGKAFIEEATKYGQKLEKLMTSKYWKDALSDAIGKGSFDANENNDVDFTIEDVNKIIKKLTGTEEIKDTPQSKDTEVKVEDKEYYDYLIGEGFEKEEALNKIKERDNTRERMAKKDKNEQPRNITSSAYERDKRIKKRDVDNWFGSRR